MIPHKLTVRNFMCYREDVPPLIFDGMHIACLSGDNGAGKSTLLDAITWALWGEARGKSDDDLIALGCDEMEVDFEWALDGVMQRVIRRRTKGKRGQSIVEFQVQNADGTWRRVSGDGVRDTDAQITGALRMSYATFINSAFLLQGRADEFTNAKPQERKQVLVDILGLADYENLEAQAKQRRNKADSELRNLEGQISEYERIEQRRPFLVEEAERAEARVRDSQTNVVIAEEHTKHMREKRDQLRHTAERRATLADDLVRKNDAHTSFSAAIQHRRERIATYLATAAERPAIMRAFAEWQGYRTRLDELEYLEPQADELIEQGRALRETINAAKAELLTRLRVTEQALQQIDEQIAAQVEHELAAAGLRREMAVFDTVRVEVEQLRMQETELLDQQSALDALLLEQSRWERTVEQARREIEAVQQQLVLTIERCQPSVDRLPQLEHELERAVTRLVALDAQAAELDTLRADIATAEREEARLREQVAAITKQGKEIGDNLRKLQSGAGMCPVCHSELGAAGQHAVEAQYGDEQARLRADVRAAKQAADQLQQQLVFDRQRAVELEQARLLRSEIDRKQATLLAQRDQAGIAHNELLTAQADLEVNNERLTAREYAHDAQAQLAQVQAQLAALGDRNQLRGQLQQVRAAIRQKEARLSGATDLAQRLAAAENEVQRGQAAAARRPALAHNVAELQRQVDTEDYACDEQARLKRVGRDYDALGYSRPAHREQKELVKQTEWAVDRRRDLDEATRDLEREQIELARDEELAEHRAKELAAQRDQLANLDEQLSHQRTVEIDVRTAEETLARARKALEDRLLEQGAAQTELIQCDRTIEQLQTYRANAVVLGGQRSIWSELVEAFGKKGIQAMLIDNALPEIEHEANVLLGRMTDQQMHVRLETQRDTKKGDPLETLDILISDNLGTRDYAMYSGGEAFRVNFALRIALSKLLAHRAGASLRTLVVDEGFGTQDGKGRERVVDAINAVADDFAKVLVITHIQELKDMFPTQIEITKGAHGSTWRVHS